MSGRLLVSLALLVLLVPATALLLYDEEITLADPEERGPDTVADRYAALVFRPEARAANFETIGLRGADRTEAAGLADTYARDLVAGDAERSRVRYLLGTAADPVDLQRALCGTGAEVSPIYGGLRYLVEEGKDGRFVLDPMRISSLERQRWADTSPIRRIHEEQELADERREQATPMALAAIVARRESDLLGGVPPWGTSLFGRWSWEDVGARYPQARAQVVRYLALLHVFVEEAVATEGFCPRGEKAAG